VPQGEKPKKPKKSFLSSIKAFIIAPLIFLIVLGAVFAYSGVWPPMVVIESKSMQHGVDSSIGVIDTGDIVIVKQVSSLGEVTTYMDAVPSGYSTYSELGDVIVYYKTGMDKPIIHRAICNLVYNTTGGGFDVPALKNVPGSMWSVPGGEKVWWNLKDTLELHGIGYANVTVVLELATMLNYMNATGSVHGGLITMGDNNWYNGPNGTALGKYDQKWINTVREPIKPEWIIGKARGELPWFGLLKLYATGTAPSYTPKNSQTDLVISLAHIIAVPVALDVSNSLLKKRGIEMFGWTKKLNPRRLWRRNKRKEPPT
jgi:signal peptidase